MRVGCVRGKRRAKLDGVLGEWRAELDGDWRALSAKYRSPATTGTLSAHRV